jgi:hypothetical protein
MYLYLTKVRMDEEVLRNLLACHPLDPDPPQAVLRSTRCMKGSIGSWRTSITLVEHPVSGYGPVRDPSPVKTATSSGVSGSSSAAPSVTRLKKPNPSGLGR